LVAGVSLTQAFADAPWYPRVLLNKGDDAVLIAPEAMFYHEIDRIHLPSAQFAAKPPTDSYETETADAELADLAVTLRRMKTPEAERDSIIEAHSTARALLRRDESNTVDVAAGLPHEFAGYFRGSVAWRRGDLATARYEWESLLNLPPTERHFKSTWAAFMLGKLLGETEPERAIEYLRQVRTLATSGFADSAGLAVASIGWEARVHRRQGNFQRSLELYLDQKAGGDGSAGQSLQFVARDALHRSKNLSQFATNPLVRRVVTAFAVSDPRISWPETGEPHPTIANWLTAVERIEIIDPDEAEMLALAAYRGAALDSTQRWLKGAPSTPVTLWLQAKLHVRAGKVNQALSLLTRVHDMFREPPDGEEPSHDRLANNILIPDGSISPRQHLFGEIGVLRMARRDYVEALDCFLRGSFWADAAYVAERVLTIEELKDYVDREWSMQPEGDSAYDKARGSVRRYLRYLLARRLARNSLPARPYFPEELQPKYDELMTNLKRGETESLPAEERAAGWFEAAKLLKSRGLQLIGTELKPDWHLTGGYFERSLTIESRTNCNPKVLVPSSDELARARRHNADPEERFHYRYQAAFIALQAASLLPDNSDEKAQILRTAGTWLMNRDPQTADIFYKHLVRRCRKTALGSAADVKRWFPVVDSAGNVINLAPVAEQPELPAPDATVIDQPDSTLTDDNQQ
jgi:tetratricopeptide (TPR) repeat protein